MWLLKNTQSKLIGEETYSLEEILDTAALELELLEDELEAVA